MADSNINGKKHKQTEAFELRLRAKARLETMQSEREKQDPSLLSAEEMQKLIQELQIHQIELEMQQEQLLQAQEGLEASRGRYFDLYDLAPVGYFTINEQEIIIEANLTAATMLRVARDELNRKPITRFILREDQDIYYLHRQKLMETGEPQTCELRLLRKDGPPFWALIKADTAKDAAGAFLCRGIITDITRLKEAETQIQTTLEEIKRLNENLEQKVNERTAELKKTITQLEEMNRAFVGRELKMAELKERNAELEKKT